VVRVFERVLFGFNRRIRYNLGKPTFLCNASYIFIYLMCAYFWFCKKLSAVCCWRKYRVLDNNAHILYTDIRILFKIYPLSPVFLLFYFKVYIILNLITRWSTRWKLGKGAIFAEKLDRSVKSVVQRPYFNCSISWQFVGRFLVYIVEQVPSELK
jgi:hypothetical protein